MKFAVAPAVHAAERAANAMAPEMAAARIDFLVVMTGASLVWVRRCADSCRVGARGGWCPDCWPAGPVGLRVRRAGPP